MYMTNKGICRAYYRASDKPAEIKKLAYINMASEDEITKIIEGEEEMSPSKLTPEQETIVGKHYLDGLTAKDISEYIPKYGAIRSYIKRAVSAGKLPRRCDIGKEKEPVPTAIDTSSESSTDEIISTVIIPAPEEKVKEIPEIVREALLEKLESRKREREIIADDLAVINTQITELEEFIRQVGGQYK